MTSIKDLNKNTKKLFVLVLVSVFFVFQVNLQMVKAINVDNFQDQIITEELRLKVPKEFRKAWLQAEKKVWEPWLSSKDGFLGRQLFWDKEREEALILVNWKSKKSWKNIPMSEVNVVQEKFEDNVKTTLNVSKSPFQLIYEGELNKQG
tara:strand:- start:339 stop:785 length:447 start_codon:yes stop_codon:yes gene_type:complete